VVLTERTRTALESRATVSSAGARRGPAVFGVPSVRTRIGRRLGARSVRFLDEPIAAALGYGLGLSRERLVLVVDIGGGTMHLALVRLSPSGAVAGRAEVVAKEARPYGGNAVDGWVLADICRQMGRPLDEEGRDDTIVDWRRLMLGEACRVKEAVYFRDTVVFKLTPPGVVRLSDEGRRASALVSFS
jgi:hypothetical protein